MSFPAPKPRNIEKDVKAFPWRILTTALRKIIGKYSANYGGNLTEVSGDSSTPPTEMPPPVTMRRTQTIDTSLSTPSHDPLPDRAATTSPRPLTIKVPPVEHDLPTLDSSVPSSSDFERRASGGLTGLSALDFSEYMFPSPGLLFPPPSAMFERTE